MLLSRCWSFRCRMMNQRQNQNQSPRMIRQRRNHQRTIRLMIRSYGFHLHLHFYRSDARGFSWVWEREQQWDYYWKGLDAAELYSPGDEDDCSSDYYSDYHSDDLAYSGACTDSEVRAGIPWKNAYTVGAGRELGRPPAANLISRWHTCTMVPSRLAMIMTTSNRMALAAGQSCTGAIDRRS